jgi:hypothetical protein
MAKRFLFLGSIAFFKYFIEGLLQRARYINLGVHMLLWI